MSLFLIGLLVLACYLLGAYVGRTQRPDEYEDTPPTKDDAFNQMDEAVEDLRDLGWTVEVSGTRDGCFVYYKLIAPGTKE